MANAISYDDYTKLLKAGQDYVRNAQAKDPEWKAYLDRAYATSAENQDQLGPSPTTDYWSKFMGTLTPQQQLGFQQNMADSGSWTDKVGSVLKYAIPAMVGGAGLAATGALGAGLQGMVGGAPLGGSALGGAAAGAGGGADILGSAAGGAYNAIPGAAAGAGSGGGLLGGLSGMGLSTAIRGVGGLLSGVGGLVNSLRRPAQADTPDFMKLALLQGQLNQDYANQITAANRPNQINAAGDTSQWVQDPKTGQWTQRTQFGGVNQERFDNENLVRNGLLGQAANSQLTSAGLPQLKGIGMSATGNSADIQNAWMNLLKPERDLARQGEIQRLKNQGLSEDSPAFQRALLRLDQADTDAQNKALIYGTQEYGNQYQRALQGANLTGQQRGQLFGERQATSAMPFTQLAALSGSSLGSVPQFGSFVGAGGVGPANVYGAGQDQYAADVANANATNANRNNLTQGLFGLANTAAKSFWG